MKVEKELSDYLGYKIVFSNDRDKAWIGQPAVINSVLKTFGEEVKDLQKYRTPGTPGVSIVRAESKNLTITQEDQRKYR